MRNSKVRMIVRRYLPGEKKPKLTSEQIEKLKTAGSLALVVLGVAGAVTLSAVAPNMFSVLDKFFLTKEPNRRFTKKEREERFMRTFYYLKKHNYIIMKPAARDFKIFLTKLGRKRLQEIDFNTLTVANQRKWNGKWWQVAADIPTKKYKWAADALRKKLREMKFYPLQRTLWFYPFDPRKEMEFIINQFDIGQFVTVMEVSRLDFDDEQRMRDFFEKEKIIDNRI